MVASSVVVSLVVLVCAMLAGCLIVLAVRHRVRKKLSMPQPSDEYVGQRKVDHVNHKLAKATECLDDIQVRTTRLSQLLEVKKGGRHR